MADFDIFKNRWHITAKLNLSTPMRIGGGQNAGAYSLSQAPVLLSYDAESKTAVPYIPGSSLKGVLRSTVERIVRTFNENESCIGVGDRKTGNVLCGKENCASCSIFGSMNTGASIRVQDAHLSDTKGNQGILEERPHCATLYDQRSDPYEMQMSKRRMGNRTFEVPKTILRMEEVVTSNTSFDLNINLDNVTEKEVGLILLALNEFNHQRCCLGGGASRGNGFAEVYGLRVVKKTVVNDDDSLFRIEEETIDPYEFCDAARSYLKTIDNGQEVERRDFDVYYKAYSAKGVEGNVVVKYDISTLQDFQMAGVDEITVTNRGIPVIPGSTIKGFLRHKLIENGTSARAVDEMFGSMRGKDGHRSRLIVSDAFPVDEFLENDVIPKGTNLSMWLVFDNVTNEELGQINEILKQPCRITGKTAAGTDKFGHSSKNMLAFKAVKLEKFDADKYLAG